MSIIKCESISFSYENKKIISDVSFEVSKGDYLCIIGENGVGKSTLAKGILGLLKLDSGKINFSDELSTKMFGYLPQQTDIQRDFPASVYEIVISGFVNKSRFLPFYSKKQKEIALNNIELLNLEEYKNKPYNELSGGQQQRVLLARALCSAAKVLVLDEPVSNLDPIISTELYDLLKKLNLEKKLTIIMVSHDVKNTLMYATDILYLDNNSYFFGKKEEFLKTHYSKKFI